MADIDRVAAVVQVVMKDGDTVYGSFITLSIQSILCSTAVIPTAASDSRKNGIAAGY